MKFTLFPPSPDCKVPILYSLSPTSNLKKKKSLDLEETDDAVVALKDMTLNWRLAPKLAAEATPLQLPSTKNVWLLTPLAMTDSP